MGRPSPSACSTAAIDILGGIASEYRTYKLGKRLRDHGQQHGHVDRFGEMLIESRGGRSSFIFRLAKARERDQEHIGPREPLAKLTGDLIPVVSRRRIGPF